GAERDVGGVAAGHVHLPELALGPDHHRLRIRRPVVVRVGAEDGPGFLLVVREAVPDRPHGARGQVQHVQHGVLAYALDEGQRLAVRRGLRPYRAAGAGHQGADLAGLAVQALDRVDQPVHVAVVVELAVRADVLGEVDVAAIRRDGRLAQVLLLVLALGQLQAGAAVAVVQPQFARAQRAGRGEVLAADQVLAVRGPVGAVEQAEVLRRHLHQVAAVGLHAPAVVAAAAVGGEGDLAATGREARLDGPGPAGADAPGLAAADRQQVDVAQQGEGDALAVRAEVQVQPGALVGAEADAAGAGMGLLDIPGRGLVGGGGRERGGQAGGEHQTQGEDERTRRHGDSGNEGDPGMLGEIAAAAADRRSWSGQSVRRLANRCFARPRTLVPRPPVRDSRVAMD